MSEDIVKESIKCLANMEIKETTYQVARSVVLDEIERLHSIIKEVREEIEYFDLQARHLDSEIYLDERLTNKLLEILDKEN